MIDRRQGVMSAGWNFAWLLLHARLKEPVEHRPLALMPCLAAEDDAYRRA